MPDPGLPPSSARPDLYVEDAIFHARRARSFSRAALGSKPEVLEMRLDAILRNLQIVGEAVKNIPRESRALRPEIPWTKIAGLRNRLVHHYFDVEAEIVEDICENHLDPLIAALEHIRSRPSSLASDEADPSGEP